MSLVRTGVGTIENYINAVENSRTRLQCTRVCPGSESYNILDTLSPFGPTYMWITIEMIPIWLSYYPL